MKAVAVTSPNDKQAQIAHLLPKGAGYTREGTDSRMSVLKCSQTFEVVEHAPPELFSLAKTCELNVKRFFCCDRGGLSVDIVLEKSVLLPQQHLLGRVRHSL